MLVWEGEKWKGGANLVSAQGFLGRKPKVWATMKKKRLKVYVSSQEHLSEFTSEYLRN